MIRDLGLIYVKGKAGRQWNCAGERDEIKLREEMRRKLVNLQDKVYCSRSARSFRIYGVQKGCRRIG